MKKQIVVAVLLVFIITSCAPSQVEIQATVQAAIAQTETAKPTATSTLTPTPTPTETPQSTPTPIPDTKQLMDKMNFSIQMLIEGSTEIVDVRFIDTDYGRRSTLQIEARATSDEYDFPSIVADVFFALNQSYHQGYEFEDSLLAFRIVGYDIDFTRQDSTATEWANVLAWFEDEISGEELIQRLILLP